MATVSTARSPSSFGEPPGRGVGRSCVGCRAGRVTAGKPRPTGCASPSPTGRRVDAEDGRGAARPFVPPRSPGPSTASPPARHCRLGCRRRPPEHVLVGTLMTVGLLRGRRPHLGELSLTAHRTGWPVWGRSLFRWWCSARAPAGGRPRLPERPGSPPTAPERRTGEDKRVDRATSTVAATARQYLGGARLRAGRRRRAAHAGGRSPPVVASPDVFEQYRRSSRPPWVGTTSGGGPPRCPADAGCASGVTRTPVDGRPRCPAPRQAQPGLDELSTASISPPSTARSARSGGPARLEVASRRS